MNELVMFWSKISFNKIVHKYFQVDSDTDIDGIETIVKPDVVAKTETTTIASLMRTKVSLVIPDIDLALPEISENIDQIGQTKIIIDATTPIPVKISKFASSFVL